MKSCRGRERPSAEVVVFSDSMPSGCNLASNPPISWLCKPIGTNDYIELVRNVVEFSLQKEGGCVTS